MNSQFNSAVFVACMNAEYEAFGRSKVYLRGMNAVLDCNDSSLAYAVAIRMNGITEDELHKLVQIILNSKNALTMYNIACKPFVTEEEKFLLATKIAKIKNTDLMNKFIRNVKDCSPRTKDVLVDAILATKSQIIILNFVESCGSVLDEDNLQKIARQVVANKYLTVAHSMLECDGGQAMKDSLIDCILSGEDVATNNVLIKRMWQCASPEMRKKMMSALFVNQNWKAESLQSFLSFKLSSEEIDYLAHNIKLNNCVYALIVDQRLTPAQRTTIIDRIIAEGDNMNIIVGSFTKGLDNANLTADDYHKIAKYLIKGYYVDDKWLSIKGFSTLDMRNMCTIFVNRAENYALKQMLKDPNRTLTREVRESCLQEIIDRYRAKKYPKLDLPDDLDALNKEFPSQALVLAKLLNRESDILKDTPPLDTLISQLLAKNANAKQKEQDRIAKLENASKKGTAVTVEDEIIR